MYTKDFICNKNNLQEYGDRQTIITMQELWECCAYGALSENSNRALQKTKLTTDIA